MAVIWKNKQFWGTLIAIGLLAYCASAVSWTELKDLWARVNLIYLIPAILCTFLYSTTRALRWRLMVSHHKQLKASRSVALYAAGQILNIVMPALTGQVGRMFLFAKKAGLRKTFVFSTIVLEVLFDAFTLVSFLFLTSLAFALPQKYEYGSVGIIIAAVTGLLLVVLYSVLRFQTQLEDLGRRRLRDRSPGLYIGITKFLRSFAKGIETLRSSQHLFGSLGYSMASWTTHVLIIYFLFKSFGFDLPIAAAAMVMIVNTLALMIPITPGNAGTFEVAVSLSLAAFPGMQHGGDAVLFALALHLLDLLPNFTLGFAFLRLEQVSIREIKEQHEDSALIDHVSEDGVLIENGEHP